MFPDVSEEYTASVFRVEAVHADINYFVEFSGVSNIIFQSSHTY
jgi:hypothetical protein